MEHGSTTGGDKESVMTDQDQELTLGERESSNFDEEKEAPPGSVGENGATAGVDKLSVKSDKEIIELDLEGSNMEDGDTNAPQLTLSIFY